MEIPPPGEEQQRSPEQIAHGIWHNLSPFERRPSINTSEIQEEMLFLERARQEMTQAISEHPDDILDELERRKRSGEQQVKRSFPPHYKAVAFVNDHVSQNMLGWAIRKHDALNPGKFSFWYQQYLGANFLLRYLTEPIASLRGDLASIIRENERRMRAVTDPENPEADPEDVTLALMDARNLESLLIKDKTGFLLADRAVDDAAEWAVANRYRHVTSGADFASDIYKQVYGLSYPSSPEPDAKR